MNKFIYNIYKPVGPTSHDIINRLRKITGIRKIGHAGTLDPLASGVLVVGITRQGTKQLTSLTKLDKEYIAEIQLGQNSSTDDAEGEKEAVYDSNNTIPKIDEIKNTTNDFVGEIEQMPPIYSAIKINGKSAYKYARAGKEVKLKSRKVKIHKIIIIKYKWPLLEIKIECVSGVYIRSLARDIGDKLKTGAYLAGLKRTKVGDFKIGDSVKLDKFKINI